MGDRRALAALFLGSFSLVCSEFLPPGLLTAMAGDLDTSEGVLGLSVSATALTALVSAIGLGSLLPRLDRRRLLVGLAALAAVSDTIVAIAPNVVVLIGARLLLGVAVGGFWSLALVVVSRIVAADRIGRGMLVVNAGTMVATVAGVPLGVLVGGALGWRATFGLAAALCALAAVVLALALPAVAPAPGTGWAALRRVFGVPGLAVGLLGIVASVGAHFAGYTYLRPAIALAADPSEAFAAGVLTAFGIGALIGNVVIGWITDRWLRVIVAVVPLTIASALVALALLRGQAVAVLVAVVWGVAFGSVINVISAWVTRLAPDRVEPANAAATGSFQLAIVAGSALGGLGVDTIGPVGSYLIAAAAGVLGAVLLVVSLAAARATEPAPAR
ncbi:MFS transporter [Naumannella huperziae]